MGRAVLPTQLNLMTDLKEKFSPFLAVIAVAALAGFAGGFLARGIESADALPGKGADVSAAQSSGVLNIPRSSLAQEEAIVNIVKKYSPAVVSVIISKNVPIVEQCFISPFGEGDPFANDPFFRRFFGDFRIPAQCRNGSQFKEIGGGTGFIISPDGLILTNKHVVADTSAEYTVMTNDERKYTAKVLARDPLKDLAVLKIQASGLPTVSLGDSNNVQVGQTAIAIGNALGEFRNTVSVGIISGLARNITASGGGQVEELRNIIQTDAAINSGNSGGPLLNLKGEVIGVNTAVAEGAQSIGFALPINDAKKAVEGAKKYGRVVYPYIGIRFVTITEKVKADNNLPVAEGAWLKSSDQNPSVLKGSPAGKAGLKAGDIITEVNGEKITSKTLLSDLIQKYNVGDTIKLKVRRGGQVIVILVTLEERKF